MAAGGDSGGDSSKVSLYDDAVKLVKRADKTQRLHQYGDWGHN